MKNIYKYLLFIALVSPAFKLYGQTFSRDTISGDTILNVKFNKDSIIKIKIEKDVRKLITVKTQKGEEKKGFEKFLSNFQLRKSFQSVKDKEDAAFVNLVYPKDTTSSQNLGFALGYNIEFGNVNALKPFIEWQRNTLSTKEQNVFLAGVSFQTYFWDLTKHPLWSPVLIAKANYKHDNVKSTEGTQVSLYLSPSFNSRAGFYPLPDAYNDNSVLSFYYNVYFGGEFEDRSQVLVADQKGSVGRWYGRITGNFYPLPKVFKERLEVVPDYMLRHAFFNKSTAEKTTNYYWKLSTNFIIAKKQAGFAEVKVGYDYIRGSDPTAGFENQQINTLSIKIKI